MFENLEAVPKDIILKINDAAKADTHPQMVNLSIGEYKDDQGRPYVPATVQEAFRQINTSDLGYTSAAGIKAYLDGTSKLLLQNFDTDQIAMQATTGGTGSLSLLRDLFKKSGHEKPIHIGDPTRGNHKAIFATSTDIFSHLTENNEINMEGYKDIITKNPKSKILIQGGLTHNPTGINFTQKQAEELVNIAKDKKMKVILDMAYFGLGQSFAADQAWLKLFWENIDDLAMNVSYSKNASIYNMRTGALFIKTENKAAVESNLQQLCRKTVSTAPATGQQIIANIINDSTKLEKRESEVGFMRKSLQRRRKNLEQALNDPRFAYIANGAGLFAILPLTPEQVEQLAVQYHIYILPSGRINIAGVNPKNVEYVADSIRAVL